jgi:hypothetical protein
MWSLSFVIGRAGRDYTTIHLTRSFITIYHLGMVQEVEYTMYEKVVLCWEAGQERVPWGVKIWRKDRWESSKRGSNIPQQSTLWIPGSGKENNIVKELRSKGSDFTGPSVLTPSFKCLLHSTFGGLRRPWDRWHTCLASPRAPSGRGPVFNNFCILFALGIVGLGI